MEATELIRKAMNSGRSILTEAESKQLLQYYDLPVVNEVVATSLEDLFFKVKSNTYPLVLKGLGARLTHKTERGLVKLNLKSFEDVRVAAREITEGAGDDLEGFLFYHMVEGRREFMAGLFRDDQFGPVVMFGLGGIFAEALGDIVFGLAPLDETHAINMIRDLRTIDILGNFRGEHAVNMEQLVRTLVGLSRLGIEHPEVREVDVNPLLVSPDGHVTAIDALVVLGDSPIRQHERPHVNHKAIRNIFHPRSIAFIGASAAFGKWGSVLFTNVVTGNFPGDIYLVNPKGGEIAGRALYKTVTDIPGPVDLAVVTVPAAKVIDLLPQMKEKGIHHMLVVTSGFSETGEEGARLENRLAEEARKSNIILLGPNTMGICNPHENLFCAYQNALPKPGSTTLLSQSGNFGSQLLAFAESEGIGIRMFIGSGNEAMVTIEDFMEFLEHDDLTKTIILYIESIKDGGRFFKAARRISCKKPVVMLKGGRTQAGCRAAASHTGALASNAKVFEAACRNAGVVMVETSSDLLDLSAAFSSLPLPKGKRVAIMTLGGGWGVISTDLCIEYGLEVPELSPDIITRIDTILPPYWSRSNPVDLVAEMDLSIPLMLLEELVKWEGCDAVIHLGILGRILFVERMIASFLKVNPAGNRQFFETIPKRVHEFEFSYHKHVVHLMERYGKPIIGVSLLFNEKTRAVTNMEGSCYKGVSFITPERAVKALSGMYAYARWLDFEGI